MTEESCYMCVTEDNERTTAVFDYFFLFSLGSTVGRAAGPRAEQLAQVRRPHVPLLHPAALVALVVERVHAALAHVLAWCRARARARVRVRVRVGRLGLGP